MEFNYKKEWARFMKSIGSGVYNDDTYAGASCENCQPLRCCPLSNYGEGHLCDQSNADKLVEFIKNWAEEHPLEVDWMKVPMGTLVEVKDSLRDNEWEKRYFVCYLPLVKIFVTFPKDKTQESANHTAYWDKCRLVKDNPEYYK